MTKGELVAALEASEMPDEAEVVVDMGLKHGWVPIEVRLVRTLPADVRYLVVGAVWEER